jgi:hypothetical protein
VLELSGPSWDAVNVHNKPIRGKAARSLNSGSGADMRTIPRDDLPIDQRRQTGDPENRFPATCSRRGDRRPFDWGREMKTKKCSAPRANADYRARDNRSNEIVSVNRTEAQTDFAAIYLAHRYGLALTLARVVAGLSSLGRAFR